MSATFRNTKYTLATMLVFPQLAAAQPFDVSAVKGRWVLETVDGKRVAAESGEIYFQITEQTISGYDGCNRFSMSVTRPSAAVGGQRGCSPEAKLLPLEPSDLVAQLGRATVSADKLSLPLPGGKGEAQFKRSP